MDSLMEAVDSSTSSKLMMDEQPDTSDGKMEAEDPKAGFSGLGIQHMPEHIIYHVFDHLPMADLAQCSRVCTRWHDMIKSWKSLWRKKRFCAEWTFDKKELQNIADAMPRLKCLHIATARKTAVHIAWPEAAVCLHCDSSGRRVQALTDFAKFDTEVVVVGMFAFPSFLDWSTCETLKKIIVGDPCFILRNSKETPFHFGDAPNAGITCDPKVFCAFCTYNHHRSCIGPECNLREPINQCQHSWCNEDKLKPPRRKHCRGKKRAHSPEHDRAVRPVPNLPEETVMLPKVTEVDLLCTFMAPTYMEFLFVACRLKILQIGCCLYNFPYLRHVQSTLEVLTLKSTPVVPPWSILSKFKKLRVLRVSQSDGQDLSLKDLFQVQNSNEAADGASSATGDN